MVELKRLLLKTLKEINDTDTSYMSSTVVGELRYLKATVEDMDRRMAEVHGDAWNLAS